MSEADTDATGTTEYRGCEIPTDRWYDLDYVWALPREDGSFTLGITDPAQTMAGRVQYAKFKKPGRHQSAGKPVARLESGKWAGGIPAPFDGTIEAVNEAVGRQPDMVNVDPYGEAWLVVFRPDNPDEAWQRLTPGSEAVEALQGWIDRYDVQCMRCAD
jgi:glycine cleavage system H protein